MWTIKNKLIAGFSAVMLILVALAVSNYKGLQENDSLVNRVAELRSPTAQASLSLLNGVNESLAGLRGWMLLGNAEFKMVRQRAWDESIDASYLRLEELSANWTNPENIERLKELKGNIELFRKYQQEIENIANTENNIPAYNMLLTQAAPRAEIMSKNITLMIDLEGGRETTVKRKKISGMMVDVRGTLGLGLANIRAYLLTVKRNFIKNSRSYGQRINVDSMISVKIMTN